VIALVLQLICTLAVLLYILAILVPGDPGRTLRGWAVGMVAEPWATNAAGPAG